MAGQTFDVEAYKKGVDALRQERRKALGLDKQEAEPTATYGTVQPASQGGALGPGVGVLVGMKLANKFWPAAASGASVPLASSTAASPTMLFPELTPMLPGAASVATPAVLSATPASMGAASSAAVPSAAGLTFSSIAAPVAAVLGPLLGGKLIEKVFYKQGPRRPFVAEEGVGSRLLEKKLPGFTSIPKEEQVNLINKAHNIGAYYTPGAGKIENGVLMSKEMMPTGIQPKLSYGDRTKLLEMLFEQTGKRNLSGASADELNFAMKTANITPYNKNAQTFEQYTGEAKSKIEELLKGGKNAK